MIKYIIVIIDNMFGSDVNKVTKRNGGECYGI